MASAIHALSYCTRNTLVAAALVTLGRKVTGKQRENGAVVWHLDSGSACGEPDAAVAFTTRAYAREPLASMAKVASAREWLLDDVIHGRFETDADPDSYSTTSLAEASLLVANNFHLRAFWDGRFYFAPCAREYAESLARAEEGTLIAWQKNYLLQLKQLVAQAKAELYGARDCQKDE